MPLQHPLSNYQERPFTLDGVPLVVEYVEARKLAAYDDYRDGLLWPSQDVATDMYYSAGRVMREPNETVRRVFAVSATAVVDSLLRSQEPDDMLSALCFDNLVTEPDTYAPVDHSTHPDVGRETVTTIYGLEVAHNPGLAELAKTIGVAITPTFDEFITGQAHEQLLQTEAIAHATRLGVGYGAAMAHNAWEAALIDYTALPDEPSV